MDSGHPPTFGIYLAAVWKLFGKSLAVSHFAMLPFLIGNIYYLEKIGNYFLKNSIATFGLVALCLIDPCFAGQAALVSPDIVIALFFLMSSYGIFSNKKIHLVIGIIGLSLISTRGYMIGGGLFLFDLINSIWIDKKEQLSVASFLNIIKPYLPGGLIAIGFLSFHYSQTGWIGYHENSPWSPAFEKVGFSGFIKNIGLLGWRLLDFGRVLLWIVAVFIFLKKYKEKIIADKKSKQLLLLFFSLLIFVSPSLLIHKSLTGHRYILPLFVVINMLTCFLIFNFLEKTKWKKILFGFCLFALASGNLWIYPKKVAQGWDSTLAHLPYYDLRNNAIDFLQKEKIQLSEVGSAFPNLIELKYVDLIESEKKFEKN